jgi:hypothetical protein
MEQQFIKDTAQTIMSIIRSAGPVAWSWGTDSFRATTYKTTNRETTAGSEMAALRFAVHGFVHTGDVVVAYNRGADLFEVYCLDGNNKVVSSRNRVYFDELVEVIDGLVEKDCPDREYEVKRDKWLAENPL